VHAARRGKYARSQDSSKENPRTRLRFQDEAILPGPGVRVKSCCSGNAILLNGVRKKRQSGDWRSRGSP
jgi:hypothetical protein